MQTKAMQTSFKKTHTGETGPVYFTRKVAPVKRLKMSLRHDKGRIYPDSFADCKPDLALLFPQHLKSCVE